MPYRFILLFLLVLTGSIAFAGDIKTSAEPELQVSGPETWVINRTKHSIDGTMLVRVAPYPNHLYAIRVLINEEPGSQHEPLARAVAKYAIEHMYFDKAKAVRIDGKPVLLVPKIGVAVIRQSSALFLSYNKGYRFQFDLTDFK